MLYSLSGNYDHLFASDIETIMSWTLWNVSTVQKYKVKVIDVIIYISVTMFYSFLQFQHVVIILKEVMTIRQ